MSCSKYQKALVSKAAAGIAERTGFARHCESCATCRAFAERFEAAENALSQPAARESALRPPLGFAGRVAASLPERPSQLAWASLRLLPVTTALALTLLTWCWLATPSPAELWTQAAEDEVLTWVSGGDG